MLMAYETCSKFGWALGLVLVACGPGPGTTDSETTLTTTGESSSSGTVPVTTSGTMGVGTTSGSSGAVTTSEGSEVTGAVTTGAVTTDVVETTGAVTTQVGETGESSEGSSSGSSGAGLCDDFVPPGCFQSGFCPEGQVCMLVDDICVSSSCSCDPPTGEIVCDPDCGGGTCVAQADCGCTSDADCVKTSTDCCPCEAGGQEAAAHKDCVEQVMLCEDPPGPCLDVDLCTPASPKCVANACVLQ
jgi:hypothetical protein